MFMTRNLNVTPKTTEHNFIVRSGKSEAEITNTRRLRSLYCTVEAVVDRQEVSRDLSATADILVPRVYLRQSWSGKWLNISL